MSWCVTLPDLENLHLNRLLHRNQLLRKNTIDFDSPVTTQPFVGPDILFLVTKASN